MNTHVIGKTDILLCTMIGVDNGDPFMVWIDTERDHLCFNGRRIRLDTLDHDERTVLRRISMLRDYAPTSEYFDACDSDLRPLINRWWRLTTN